MTKTAKAEALIAILDAERAELVAEIAKVQATLDAVITTGNRIRAELELRGAQGELECFDLNHN